MPINHDAVGTRGEPATHSWDERDVMLYALGVGAGTDELQFTTENTTDVTLRVLPTMAVVLGGGGFGPMEALGDFDWAMLVHGEQRVEVYGEIPTSGTVSTVGEIVSIYDKGKGALVAIELTSTLEATGKDLFKTTMSVFIRGEGGWGGDRGPSGPRNVPPEREPDHTVTYQTREDQALLYRLSGDRNPLHSDPAFAAFGGFDRPILHGLCTYGFSGRAVLHSVLGGDPARFRSMDGRFTSPVLPGEALTVRVWDGDDHAIFQTCGPDGRIVIDAGRCDYA